MINNRKISGKVIMAGAGPGDPELLSIKAARYLQKADVILCDRLVSEEILTLYANENAEIIFVGKQARAESSTPQATINDLMIEYACRGKLVVRLKGGDVSIFSNILDELRALVEHNIPYEIIPGITAALGAAAYSGIPLTARDHSNAVRFLTYYKPGVITDSYWKELAKTSDTLVFYMAGELLDDLVAMLVTNKIGKDKSLAVIEQATTPLQNVTIVSIQDYTAQFQGRLFISPAIVIIGKVVALHAEFKWLENNSKREYYFEPVASKAGHATKKLIA